MSERAHDLVLLGASGFTGRLVAEYLARRLTPGVHRWALAGRTIDALRTVRSRIAAIDAAWANVPLLQADTDDFESLCDLAARTRVLLTTVGPYARLGEPVVKACVDHGADYLDLTGEPAFWRTIVQRYHERATAAGVIVVPCCGFDSVPADLAVLRAVQELGARGAVHVDAYVAASGRFSGGTWASALGIMADRSRGGGSGERSRGARPRVHFSREVDRWVAPMPVIDPLVVRRSAMLLDAEYGEPFSYRQYVQAKSLPQLVKLGLGVGVVAGLAKIPPLRRRLAALRPSGRGPSEAERARAWFAVHVHARAERSGRSVRVDIRGGDPGYGETPMMMGEAAMCLLHDRDALRFAGGVLTPAAAFGRRLLDAIADRGLRVDVAPMDT